MNIQTFQEVLDLHNSTVSQVLNESYYPEEFDTALDEFLLNEHSIRDLTDTDKICSFWNYFWNLLPDSKAIRQGPFFNICDLAEGAYTHAEN